MTTGRPSRSRSPRLARWLLSSLLHPDDRDFAISDVDEEFEMRCTRDGTRQARRWYRAQVWRSAGPSIARRWGRIPMHASPMEVPVQAAGRDRASLLVEARWVWRGLRARGWRAAFIVLLLGVALAANAVVFAAADAFVFRTVPYADASTLVVIERTGRSISDYLWPQALKGWREHRDVFAGVHAHIRGASVYLTSNGVTESVATERVTPGLFETLGILPRWGRPFITSDAEPAAPKAAIISESLARRLYGDAASAPGQDLFTGSETLSVIGVMPASFRFPTSREEIWRPFDVATWPNNSGLRNIARLANGQSEASARVAFAERSAAVEQLVEHRQRDEHMQLRSMAEVRGNLAARTVFSVLVAAAACLLLIACANVASLEVAASARRVRDHAIQAALGASRAALVRVSLAEGAVLLAGSAGLALLLTSWGVSLLDKQLTVAMRDALTNPLDLDPRALFFMVGVAASAWLLTALPAARRLSRLAIVDGLRDDPRTMPVTRSASRARQVLMAGQVALTTVLLAGALLYMRTYAAKVGVAKGFDDSNIATITVSPAPDAALKSGALEDRVLERLRVSPGVVGIARTSSLPPATQSGIGARLTVLGREPTDERLMLHFASVDPGYFRVVGVAIVQGRAFEAGSAADEVVIDERFARTYWPDGTAIGARFKMQSAGIGGVSDFRVVGVSRQLRADRLRNEEGDEVYVSYIQISPTYHPLTFVARLDHPRRLAQLTATVRAEAPRSIVRVDTVAARYARLDADTRLVAAVTGGFGGVALLVAVTGIYAVMAFLVAGRSREIAIRMALGADRQSVRRLVLGTALRSVGAGAAIGLSAAVGAAHVVRAQLFGVTPSDPVTYAGIAALILMTALVATWWPARRATRVNPATALRD